MAQELATGSGRVQLRRLIRPLPISVQTRRFLAFTTGVIVADQTTKLWGHLSTEASLVEPVHNPEMALGVIGGPPLVLIMAMIGALVIFASYLLRRMYQGRIPPLVPAFLVGGALGNIIDRLLLGAVRDFIPTPLVVFNIADVALVVGVAGYLLSSTINGKRVGPR